MAFGVKVILVPTDRLPARHRDPVSAKIVPDSFVFVMPLVRDHGASFGIEIAKVAVLAPNESSLRTTVGTPFRNRSTVSATASNISK